MKAAFRDIPLKPIYAIYVGDTPIKSVWKGDKKIWPDNSQRVTRIWLDMEALTDMQQVYWNHALQNISTGASARRFIRLTVSRIYNIGSTYSNVALATYEGNGCISFPAGTGPLANEVVAGKKCTIRMVMPGSRSADISGTSTLSIPPAGSQIRMLFSKAQKKVTTQCRVVVKGYPSGETLANVWHNAEGHDRYNSDWEVMTFRGNPYGDSYITITCTGGGGAQDCRYAYIIYPALDITLTPTILRTETTTIHP